MSTLEHIQNTLHNTYINNIIIDISNTKLVHYINMLNTLLIHPPIVEPVEHVELVEQIVMNVADNYLYQKPWNKLTQIHKVIKMKEYTNQLLFANEKDKDDMSWLLINMIKQKLLTNKSSIIYDSSKGKIVSIPCLEYKNNKYIIKKNI